MTKPVDEAPPSPVGAPGPASKPHQGPDGASPQGAGGRRLADFLPYRLSVASNAVSSLIAEHYRARFALKIPEWRVMAVLGDSGRMTQRELTEATLMDKVAVNRACKALVDRGLVHRLPNDRDARSHLLELTGEGRAVFGEIMPLAIEIERELFSVLDEEERRQLFEVLGRLLRRANQIRPA